MQLPRDMQQRRDHMVRSLQLVGLRPMTPQGSYFFMADISDFSAWDWPGGTGSGGGGLPRAQHGLRPPGNKIPNLPGTADEPFDKRFVKWMIKEKVGWACTGGPACGFQAALLPGADGPKRSPASPTALLQGCTHFKERGAGLVCTEVPSGPAGQNSWP